MSRRVLNYGIYEDSGTHLRPLSGKWQGYHMAGLSVSMSDTVQKNVICRKHSCGEHCCAVVTYDLNFNDHVMSVFCLSRA